MAPVKNPGLDVMVIANRIQRAIDRVPSYGIDVKETFDNFFKMEVVSAYLNLDRLHECDS